MRKIFFAVFMILLTVWAIGCTDHVPIKEGVTPNPNGGGLVDVHLGYSTANCQTLRYYHTLLPMSEQNVGTKGPEKWKLESIAVSALGTTGEILFSGLEANVEDHGFWPNCLVDGSFDHVPSTSSDGQVLDQFTCDTGACKYKFDVLSDSIRQENGPETMFVDNEVVLDPQGQLQAPYAVVLTLSMHDIIKTPADGNTGRYKRSIKFPTRSKGYAWCAGSNSYNSFLCRITIGGVLLTKKVPKPTNPLIPNVGLLPFAPTEVYEYEIDATGKQVSTQGSQNVTLVWRQDAVNKYVQSDGIYFKNNLNANKTDQNTAAEFQTSDSGSLKIGDFKKTFSNLPDGVGYKLSTGKLVNSVFYGVNGSDLRFGMIGTSGALIQLTCITGTKENSDGSIYSEFEFDVMSGEVISPCNNIGVDAKLK
ncbi:MAG: hypothetical protein A3F54_05640 [Candidatus Kerfeldbacteria bacterium RIFCSPHIGHO2_12_FULL_48_17]|uniref:Uncharacterized protein n=1 Tax=Candidatus Kerfeldbacteria bacterium RIFCSPHIGHO2_12_FULL_48_17 TaxID=1798542 RepID=A0A1G2B8H0_9BACT|nr:MAG: hypothetical protein A3F54_05640 [Candidatus Kerfeldbacteria bacterium RIFCSPHIGHO2_12_FULL_48_17]